MAGLASVLVGGAVGLVMRSLWLMAAVVVAVHVGLRHGGHGVPVAAWAGAARAVGGAALCAIAKDEGPYMDEWLEYHFGLGFRAVYVYDNGDTPSLAHLTSRFPGLTVLHVPGPDRQMHVYNHFLHTYGARHKWCCMLDVDEFIVLRKHASIEDLLQDHCPSGALALNWYMFGTGGQTVHRPEPVTRRFQRRAPSVDQHVKCLMKTSDALFFANPHYPVLKPGAAQRDTRGTVLHGPFNPDGPVDVAVIHHYFTKSMAEYEAKRLRGHADKPGNSHPAVVNGLDGVHDASAWDLFRSFCRSC
jgi:hypothetical protein